MKSKAILSVLFLTSSFAAHADVALTENDLLGEWKIEGESLHADGSDMTGLNTTWTFNNDGTMEGLSTDANKHARVGEFRAVLNYKVEDGKLIKQAMPGRSKYETCVAVEREGAKMKLKCESIYFFMTKTK